MRNRRAISLFSVLSILLLWAAAPRVAQGEEKAPIQAERHFEAGNRAYRLGDFKTAVREWKQSYQIFASPVVLFNLAQAYRQLGQYEDAAFAYRQYLSTAPATGKYRPIAEEKVAELEKLIEQQRKAQQSPPTGAAGSTGAAATGTGGTAPAKPAQEPAASAGAGVGTQAVPPRDATAGSTTSSKDVTAAPRSRTPGIALTVAGSVALVAGVVLLGHGASLDGSANEAPTLDERNDRHGMAVGEQIGGAVAAGLGVAAVVAGSVLLLRRGGEARPQARALWIAPTLSGFVAGGTF